MNAAPGILTWSAAALPLAVALLFGLSYGFHLSLGGGTFLDYLAFLLGWSWIVGTPFLAGTALVLERKRRRLHVRIVCGAALVVWLVGGGYLLFATS